VPIAGTVTKAWSDSRRNTARLPVALALFVSAKLLTPISNGDPLHIEAGVRVLAHQAKLNGYAVEPEQSLGLSSFSIHLHPGEEKK
jgi:hypothetical protein